MARWHYNLERWNLWLSSHYLGQRLMEAEQQLLSRLLKNHFGKHALLIGAPHQAPLLQSTMIARRALLSPLMSHDSSVSYIESAFHELPILTGSVDLVVLPHTLELVDNPRHLLTECCRIIKPEGLIAIAGFNPYSCWGVKKMMSNQQTSPWAGHLIQTSKIKHWLSLADFALESQSFALHRPPINHPPMFQRLHFLENIVNKCLPFTGGVYVVLARAKVIPLTPIRMKWTQQLSGMRISTTLPGHIARQSK